jgi:hypothetical protein
MLKRCAFVLVDHPCGGAAPKKETTVMPAPAKSECTVMADHVADLALTFKDPPPTTKDVIADMLRTRCETDAWSADSKKCFGGIANEQDAEKCIGTLSNDQRDKVTADAKARFGKPGPHGEDPTEGTGTPMPADDNDQGGRGRRAPEAPTGSPPPPTRAPVKAPAKAPKSKAPAKGGGAPAKGDPCEGGE